MQPNDLKSATASYTRLIVMVYFLCQVYRRGVLALDPEDPKSETSTYNRLIVMVYAMCFVFFSL